MNSDWVWKTFLLCCTLHCIWLDKSFNEGTVAVFRGGGRKCTSEKFLRSNWTLDSMASKNYHQFKWKERERGRKGRRLESGRHRREEILKGGRWRCSTLATPRGPACKKLLHQHSQGWILLLIFEEAGLWKRFSVWTQGIVKYCNCYYSCIEKKYFAIYKRDLCIVIVPL